MREDDFKLLAALRHSLNLTKTAELLYTTQPTVTRRIQQMEKEYQVPILERSNKGVRFTPQGEYLAQQGERMLAFLDETRVAVRQIESHQFGRIRLAAANSYGQYTLPSVLRQYQAIHPNVQFDIVTTLSERVLRLVKAGEADVGIVRGEYSFHGVKVLLSREKCFVFSKQPLALADLPFSRRVDYPLSGSNQDLVESWWEEQFSVPPTKGYRVSSLSICREMVLQGLGYGISLVGDLDPTNQFFHLPMTVRDGGQLYRNTWLLQGDNSREDPVVNEFVKFLLDNGAV